MKAADSPWKLNDRSNNWLKIKPEYVEVLPSVLAPDQTLGRKHDWQYNTLKESAWFEQNNIEFAMSVVRQGAATYTL